MRIKWPNDLVLEGRKLAGILTEASLSGRGVDHVVIGIGVNLRQRSDDFSPEVARIATSLEAQGYPADRAALETALAEALCQAFGHLHTPEVYAADYRRLCLNLGQTLRIPDTGETVTALDIDRQYGLVVRRRDGTVDTLRCGEVSVPGSVRLCITDNGSAHLPFGRCAFSVVLYKHAAGYICHSAQIIRIVTDYC